MSPKASPKSKTWSNYTKGLSKKHNWPPQKKHPKNKTSCKIFFPSPSVASVENRHSKKKHPKVHLTTTKKAPQSPSDPHKKSTPKSIWPPQKKHPKVHLTPTKKAPQSPSDPHKKSTPKSIWPPQKKHPKVHLTPTKKAPQSPSDPHKKSTPKSIWPPQKKHPKVHLTPTKKAPQSPSDPHKKSTAKSIWPLQKSSSKNDLFLIVKPIRKKVSCKWLILLSEPAPAQPTPSSPFANPQTHQKEYWKWLVFTSHAEKVLSWKKQQCTLLYTSRPIS